MWLLTLATAALAQADAVWPDSVDECSPYTERTVGTLDGAPVVAVTCGGAMMRSSWISFGARVGNGPLADIATVGSAVLLDVSLVDKALVWRFQGTPGPYTGVLEWSTFTSSFDAATKAFGKTEPVVVSWGARQRELLDARLAKNDLLGAIDVVWVSEDGVEGDNVALDVLRLLRDAALADHRAGSDRVAGDRLLGGLTREFSLRDIDLTVGDAIEVVNDVGYLLDLGGESKRALPFLDAVIKAQPTARPVAHLNRADALWNLGDPAATAAYKTYLSLTPKPTKQAKIRATATPPAPPPRPDDAATRVTEALAQGDLLTAVGAAGTAKIDLQARGDWWQAGATELVQRHQASDFDGFEAVERWLGRMPKGMPDVALQAVLAPKALALATGPNRRANLAARWLVGKQGLEAALARWRLGGSPLGPAMAEGKGEVVVALSLSAAGGLCAHLAAATPRVVCTAGEPPPVPPRISYHGCIAADWPCFVTVAQSGGFGCEGTCGPSKPPKGPAGGSGHVCGLDPVGGVHCAGNDAFAKRDPPVGSFIEVATGRDHACAWREDGTVACWGSAPGTPATWRGVGDVAAAGDWTCLLTAEGAVTCHGKDAPVLPALPKRPAFLTDADYVEAVRQERPWLR